MVDKELKRKKARAQLAARQSISIDGKVCQECGSTEKVERHHPDYDKPLEVEILCRKCHRTRHPDRRRALLDFAKTDPAIIRSRIEEIRAAKNLTIEDWTKILGVTPPTIRRLIDEAGIPARKAFNGRIIIDEQRLLQLIARVHSAA